MGTIKGGRPLNPIHWSQRTEELACLYQKLGTLEAVAQKAGITRERVRQILTRGRQHKICAYNPRQALCDRLSILPNILKTATTFKEAGTRLGYSATNNTVDGLGFLIKKFGLPRRVIKKQVQENYRRTLRATLLKKLQQHARRLNTPELSTTILEKDREAKCDYTRWTRQFGGIHELRKELGVEVYVRKGWGDNSVHLKQPPLFDRLKKLLTF